MANRLVAFFLGCFVIAGSLGAGEDESIEKEVSSGENSLSIEFKTSSDLPEMLRLTLQHERERVQLELRIYSENIVNLHAAYSDKIQSKDVTPLILSGDQLFREKKRIVELLDSLKNSNDDEAIALFNEVCSYYDTLLISNLVDALCCSALWGTSNSSHQSVEKGVGYLAALKELFISESQGGMPERRLERAVMVIHLLLADQDELSKKSGLATLEIQSRCVPFARYDQNNFKKIPQIQGGFAILREYSHHHVSSWNIPAST